MQTREIPHAEWATFFDDLSRRMNGIPTTVETFSPDFGAQIDAHDLPLVGISDDPKAADGERIDIILDNVPPLDDYTRAVLKPRRVLVESNDDGRIESLEIESDEGVRTLVRLGSPAVMPIR